jgi:hypothetical protein
MDFEAIVSAEFHHPGQAPEAYLLLSTFELGLTCQADRSEGPEVPTDQQTDSRATNPTSLASIHLPRPGLAGSWNGSRLD